MFNFAFDKRTITIVIIVMLVLWLISAGTDGILSLLLTIPGVLIALTFHEFAHAWAANKLGDDTPRMQGRLNFRIQNLHTNFLQKALYFISVCAIILRRHSA